MTAKPTPVDPDVLERDSRGHATVRYLATHPHLVLVGVLVLLILVTGVVESNYLSVNGLRNSALFAVPDRGAGGRVRRS